MSLKTHQLKPYIIFSLILLALSAGIISLKMDAFGSKTKLRRYLLSKLTLIKNVPPGTTCDAAYVLGGSPSSLLLKFKTASLLYHQGMCKKIMVMHRPGITEYDGKLQRNLTNDEWSITELEKLGIPRKHIEIVPIKKGFFGTFSEARSIASLAIKRKYGSLLLVTAPYHTRRSFTSFDYFLKMVPIRVYIEASGEKAFVRGLTLEYIKLEVYKLFLLSNQSDNITGFSFCRFFNNHIASN